MKEMYKFSIEIDEAELSEMKDKYNGNTNVYVKLEDGFSLSITVGTAKNLEFLMKKDNRNFFEPGPAWIIVQKLTTEIIQEAVEAYMKDRPDGYWLKLSYFGNDIDISVFDQLQAEEVKESKKYEIIRGLDELKNKIDKLAKLDQDSFKKEQSDILANLNELYQFLDNKPL
uniref:hypothetical protein n=1 Tax=Pleurosigma intermedium TaxID=197753 RepID=UPI00218251FF|nr:hypothetical protein N4L43_pgp137 [Pleurosigma intermedium]UVG41983.1 hypothetical protein [Pleurosigma intermedium]